MFARWGRFMYRRRRWVAAISLAIAAFSLVFAARAGSALSTGGWYDPSSESQRVARDLAATFGTGQSSLVVLFEAPGRSDATSPAFQREIGTATARLAGDPRVDSIVGYAQTGATRFVSKNGDASWVLVQLKLTDDQAISAVGSLRAEIDTPAGMHVSVTGEPALSAAISAQSEQDLGRAETVSLPIALLILLLVFGSLVAAGVPLLVAGLTIPTTLAAIWGVARFTNMSVFVSSVATMLGLALAIDYSLFMVSRFRDELERGQTVARAVEVTVATSGKAVAFSGSAVALGLSGLLFFRAPTIASIGAGGVLIALASVAYALTFLPALLGMLGPRISSLRLRLPSRRPTDGSVPASRWESLAGLVMRRPVAVLVPVLVLLVSFGIPFLGARLGLPGASVVSSTNEARVAWETIDSRFPAGETSPIEMVATVKGGPLSPANARVLATYAARIAALPGVSRVDGPFSLVDPKTGARLDPAAVAAVLSAPASSRPGALDALIAADVRGSTVRLQAITPAAGTAAARDLVQTIRHMTPEPGVAVAVGGSDAGSVDFLAAQDEQLPIAIGFILVAMAAMLFLQFGSLVLPLKGVVMTLLSLTASFGALVWIFQDGNLSGLLGFTAPGTTIAIVPILMFSVVFGLSMDYEVLLLSRIQEIYRRTGDNAGAVGRGLAETGRVITGAALIMVTVFAAFGLADTLVIKSLGVGMAIAVLLDATVIRALLVPATMRLLGDWNWWAPRRLAGLVDRLGFSHVEPAVAASVGVRAPGDVEDERDAAAA